MIEEYLLPAHGYLANAHLEESHIIFDLPAELFDLVEFSFELGRILVLLGAEPEIIAFVTICAVKAHQMFVFARAFPRTAGSSR